MLVTYLRRMRNNSLEIRIAGSSCRQQLGEQQLCMCISRQITTKTEKCLISRLLKDVDTSQRLCFSFPGLPYSLWEFNSRKFSNIWLTERDGISAIKFEAGRTNFLNDAFVPVALVGAWAPYHYSKWLRLSDSAMEYTRKIARVTKA